MKAVLNDEFSITFTFLLIIIFVMSVGFALLGSNLKVTATGTVSGDWDVHFVSETFEPITKTDGVKVLTAQLDSNKLSLTLNTTFEKPIQKTRVMSEETAYMMTSLLQSSAQYGLGSQSYVNGATYGAKTGTSNYSDATIRLNGYPSNAVNDLWVAGISPDYSISVWYGYS